MTPVDVGSNLLALVGNRAVLATCLGSAEHVPRFRKQGGRNDNNVYVRRSVRMAPQPKVAPWLERAEAEPEARTTDDVYPLDRTIGCYEFAPMLEGCCVAPKNPGRLFKHAFSNLVVGGVGQKRGSLLARHVVVPMCRERLPQEQGWGAADAHPAHLRATSRLSFAL